MRSRGQLVSVAFLGIAVAFASQSASQAISYPESVRVEQFDVYHGTRVGDPYRWLEQDVRESSDVAAWVAAQNEVTFAHLASIPERNAIRERLTELWDYEKLGTPWGRGGLVFFTRNDGLQNQSVLYVTDSWNHTPRVLLDPNSWSDDGTVALAGTAVSPNGRFLAYGTAEAGSDWRHWRVLEIESGRVLDEKLEWVKFSGVEWTPDSKGFLYGRFEAPREGSEFQSLNLNQRLYYHRVGTPQSSDILVFRTPDHPTWRFSANVTEDGRYLVISTRVGTDDRNRVIYKDLDEPLGMPIELIDHFENEFTFVASRGPVLYFRTDLDAPKRRIIAIDLRQPGADSWREIVPESGDTLRWSRFVGNTFILGYLRDAKTAVRIHAEDGRLVREVDLPGIGTASGFWGRRADTETFYSFSSFNEPNATYHYDLLTGTSRLLQRADVGIDPDDFEVEQVFYESTDGTRVPMFIVHRKGIQLDGSNPTLLYGYGGFDVPQVPRFSIARLAWMEMGGVFALANLRGGGEYGA
jgi:prolyl oligopeptidase